MTAVVFYISAAAIVALASLVAFCVGRRQGRAIGWLEHYEQTVAKDRARRNRLGQFREVAR